MDLASTFKEYKGLVTSPILVFFMFNLNLEYLQAITTK